MRCSSQLQKIWFGKPNKGIPKYRQLMEDWFIKQARAVGRSENPREPVVMWRAGIICPGPGWDRVNWSAKIWGWSGTNSQIVSLITFFEKFGVHLLWSDHKQRTHSQLFDQKQRIFKQCKQNKTKRKEDEVSL